MVSLELEARLENLLSIGQAETANLDLFAPIPLREECPICLIPLPKEENQTTFNACCGKRICLGCSYREALIHRKNGVKKVRDHKCAFCRQPIAEGRKKIKALKKLMKKNNPEAFILMGIRYKGEDASEYGLFQSDTKSLEMYTRAAELGYADAYKMIGNYYEEGIAVEQDRSKALAFYEVSAKKGSIYAHGTLIPFHGENGDFQRSTKHMKVVASAGCKDSMNGLMVYYRANSLPKDDLTQILRAFQSSSNEMKSKDRDDARDLFSGRRAD